MRLTIVGGCFPVQHNIPPDRLYHHALGLRLALPAPGLRVDVIRYERFRTCLARVQAAADRAPIDVLLFHLRAEPVLRLLKLYYRHLNHAGQLRHALNLPGLGLAPSERFDLLTARPARPLLRAPAPPSYSPGARLGRELNYRLGSLLGNQAWAFRQYSALVLTLADFCRIRGIRLLVMGPVSRPCSAYENQLSKKLAAYFEAKLAAHGVEYIDALGERDAQGQALFLPGGIYVSPVGHGRVAEMLYQRLEPTV